MIHYILNYKVASYVAYKYQTEFSRMSYYLNYYLLLYRIFIRYCDIIFILNTGKSVQSKIFEFRLYTEKGYLYFSNYVLKSIAIHLKISVFFYDFLFFILVQSLYKMLFLKNKKYITMKVFSFNTFKSIMSIRLYYINLFKYSFYQNYNTHILSIILYHNT